MQKLFASRASIIQLQMAAEPRFAQYFSVLSPGSSATMRLSSGK